MGSKLTVDEARSLLKNPYVVRAVKGREDVVCIQTPFFDIDMNPILVFAGREEKGDGFIVDDGGLILADMAVRGVGIMGKKAMRIRQELLKTPARGDVLVMRDALDREWIERRVDTLSGAAFHDFLGILVIFANLSEEWVPGGRPFGKDKEKWVEYVPNNKAKNGDGCNVRQKAH